MSAEICTSGTCTCVSSCCINAAEVPVSGPRATALRIINFRYVRLIESWCRPDLNWLITPDLANQALNEQGEMRNMQC